METPAGLPACLPAGTVMGTIPTDPQDRVCSIEQVSESDATDFLRLQDAWAECHFDLAKSQYPAVTMRDWQLLLCCPAPKILDSPKGRAGIFKTIALGKAIYGDITILKAVARFPGQCADEEMIGFVMYERMDFPRGGRGQGSTSSSAAPSSPCASVGMDWTSDCERASTESGGGAAAVDRPWLQVKQLYVDPAHRHGGIGRMLLKAVLEAHCDSGYLDIRLQVIDLNLSALEWYRALGFIVSELSRRFLGDNNQGNIVVYKKMLLRAQPAIRSFGAPGAPLPLRARIRQDSDGMAPCQDEAFAREVLAEALPFATASEAVWAAQKAAAAANKILTSVPQKILASAASAVALGDLSKSLQLPVLFRQEIVGEVVTINYPDGSGAFKVRVAGWDNVNKWHKVTSDGLSTWDDQNFDDEVDLNLYYRSGHAAFQRTLSSIHRTEWARKRSIRHQQAEQRAKIVKEKEKEERALMEVALASDGPLTRSRRKVIASGALATKAASTAKRSSFPSPSSLSSELPPPPKKSRPSRAAPKLSAAAVAGAAGAAGPSVTLAASTSTGAALAGASASAASAASKAAKAARAANARAARSTKEATKTKTLGGSVDRHSASEAIEAREFPQKRQHAMAGTRAHRSSANSCGSGSGSLADAGQKLQQQQQLTSFFKLHSNLAHSGVTNCEPVASFDEDIDFTSLVIPPPVVDPRFTECSRGTGPAPLGLHFNFQAHSSSTAATATSPAALAPIAANISAIGPLSVSASTSAAALIQQQAQLQPAALGRPQVPSPSSSFSSTASASSSLLSSVPSSSHTENLSTPSRSAARKRKGPSGHGHTNQNLKQGLRRRPSSPEKLPDSVAKLRPAHASQKLI